MNCPPCDELRADAALVASAAEEVEYRLALAHQHDDAPTEVKAPAGAVR